MDPNKRNISSLEALPQDILGIIVSKVGAIDPEAFVNCVSSCKELSLTANDERVSKTLNLTPLVKNPRASNKYPTLMKKCLENNNLDAHYIKGILSYFVLNNTLAAFHHLKIAADEGHKEAIYLYAILLLCTGRFDQGKKYLGILKWAKTVKSLKCAGKISKSHCRELKSCGKYAMLFLFERWNRQTYVT